MKTVCDINKCSGCMACIDICPKNAITILDDLSTYNAMINEKKCISCNACHGVCPNDHPLKTLSPINWKQGWAEDEELRATCSSGGFATEIARAFIQSGGVVCSCTFFDGKFVFGFADKVTEVKKFTGSKYVKSNPIGSYKQTKIKLLDGNKVLFIGLPCQVAALKNYIGDKLCNNLYTIDLICHGTPSPKLLNLFLKQYGLSLKDLQEIHFRKKAKFQVYGDHKGIITNGVSDRYSIAFLNGLTYTENCYICPYAKKERVSDLTLGDSWGSNLPQEECKKGISLALIQTEKGEWLLNLAALCLKDVDLDNAVSHNHQLEYPSKMPGVRVAFFNRIKYHRFNLLVFQALPKASLRQDIKHFLIKMKLYRDIKL